MDSKKARVELSWHDSTSIDEGIENTQFWIKENFDNIKDLLFNYIHKP